MTNNWKEMPAYLDLCDQYDAYASFHKVSQPVNLGIRYLSSAELDTIYSYLKNYEFTSSFKTPKSQQNAKHYYSYVEQIKIWRDKQLENESKSSHTITDLKQHLYTTIQNSVKQSDDKLVLKLKAIIESYSDSSQQKLISELIKTDALIIVQRLQYYSIQQIKEEILSLYQINYE